MQGRFLFAGLQCPTGGGDKKIEVDGEGPGELGGGGFPFALLMVVLGGEG